MKINKGLIERLKKKKQVLCALKLNKMCIDKLDPTSFYLTRLYTRLRYV